MTRLAPALLTAIALGNPVSVSLTLQQARALAAALHDAPDLFGVVHSVEVQA